jgi:hypothetical protein
VPAQARAQVGHVARNAFISGLNELFLVGAGLAIVGAVLAAFLIRQRDFVPSGQEAAAAAAA